MATCRESDCDGPAVGRGWCGKHYMRWRSNGDPNIVRTTARDAVARFHEKVDKREAWECWMWRKSLMKGYGYFHEGGTQQAHRWFYEQVVGPIPEGLVLDHLCRNRACVNPNHLEPVTHAENILRGEGLAARAARRTHCPQGHEYTFANTYLRRGLDGSVKQRVCRACKNGHEKMRKRTLRAKEVVQ